jgi:hypothetical protein
MSVLATLNLADKKWQFAVAPESPSPNIEIGFREGNGPAVFDNLSFGLSVTVDGEIKFFASYPPEGTTYLRTDQTYLSSDCVNLAADDLATFSVWAENARERYEGDVTFTVPRPAQPYPSWVWDGAVWQPPVAYPEGKGLYSWDEEAGQWATVSAIDEQGDH